jgi:hypothetical protein
MRVSTLFIVLLGLSVAWGMTWEEYKQTYDKTYSTQKEDRYRERVWMSNVEVINLHNRNKERTYDMGVNQFTDLTDEEFLIGYHGLGSYN